jgi:hypothetical protein
VEGAEKGRRGAWGSLEGPRNGLGGALRRCQVEVLSGQHGKAECQRRRRCSHSVPSWLTSEKAEKMTKSCFSELGHVMSEDMKIERT